MLFVQRKIKYHPTKELNKQQTNAEQTMKTNQHSNKTGPKKTEQTNILNTFMGFVRKGPR
jgi:hypothetical protein